MLQEQQNVAGEQTYYNLQLVRAVEKKYILPLQTKYSNPDSPELY